MTRARTILGLVCGASASFGTGLATPAAAQALVLGSDSAQLRPGRILDKGEALSVPKGSRVRIMLPSGETRVFKGPQEIAAADLASKAPANTELWDSVAAYVTTPPPEDEPFTRGLAAASTPPDRFPFSWHDIPVTSDGDICVEKGVGVSLVRTSTDREAIITIVDVQGGGKRAEARFPKGQEKAPWPDGITPKIGTFALTEAGQSPRQFRMRLISPLPAAEEAIRVLHGQRCELQRNALIDALRDPAFDPAKAGR